ncbi:MAG: signal peptidase I [Armatimonadota bacterium]|nr:signal peptidase I [Armatimonadota bacterium]MCX7778372.1 signal peptidase I [Armatimonadota bacterium]MDW8026367.1 signal peptidase I [Armatimonadota bacterium]
MRHQSTGISLHSLNNKCLYARLRVWLTIGIFAVTVVCIMLIRIRYLLVVEVTSNSMAPTILQGERLLFLKGAYSNTVPRRGDIVVLQNPLNKEELIVKRVVGLPGEFIATYRGKVCISSKPIDEPYVGGIATIGLTPMLISDGHVYLLGDNRSASEDSRDFGPVPINKLLGKLLIRISPLNRFGRVQ